jgi:amino acid transporter
MSILNPIIFAAFYGLICVPVAFFGRDRKWGFWGYFFASLLMSPIVGLLFVLASDKPKACSRARCKNQC